MKSFMATPATIRRDWYIVDAAGKTLGRLAAGIAKRLRGKHKPEFTPHMDTGDYIVVINASQVRVSGKKIKDKLFYNHSGYQGGLKIANFETLIRKKPEQVIKRAVRGMLPKGPLGRDMFRKLKIYPGTKHKHSAQQPKLLDI
jgi:ribosomal protein L13, bacterial type